MIIAVSGGQDSLCLLQLIRDLQPKWDWEIAIAHCNHRWPPDSGDNAIHVAQLAQRWQLKLYLFIASQVLKGEAQGRNWRYQVMTDCARAEGYRAIVTAHTASDRAETLLLNLMRGSGLDGLQALSWQRPLAENVVLVRPLLDWTRAETGAFCEQFSLPIWQDGMNQDLNYRRNRIRLEVLPYWREHFNPKVDQAIAQTAELFQADVEYLEQQAEQLLKTAIVKERTAIVKARLDSDVIHDPDVIHDSDVIHCLDRRILAQAPLALQRRVVRQFLAQSLGSALGFAQVEKVVRLIHGDHRDRTDSLMGRWVAQVSQYWIVLWEINPCSQDPKA